MKSTIYYGALVISRRLVSDTEHEQQQVLYTLEN